MKTQKRSPNGFEQLVAKREAAKQKRSVKFVAAKSTEEKDLQRLKSRFSEVQGLLTKRGKQHLFDLGSDDETVFEPVFAQKELLPHQSAQPKSKRDKFHEIIQKSKQLRSQRAEQKEERRDLVEELNEKFAAVSQKVKYVTRDNTAKDKISQFNGVLSSLRPAPLLPPLQPVRKPVAPSPERSADEELHGYAQEEFEEKEVAERRAQVPASDAKVKGILRFNAAVEELRGIADREGSEWSVDLDPQGVSPASSSNSEDSLEEEQSE